MSANKKLSRNSAQRKALLKSQVTNLLVNGSILTTASRAQSVQSQAEKIISLAVKEYKNYDEKEVQVSHAKLDGHGMKILESKTSKNDANYDVVSREVETKTVQVDRPSRLAARRKLLGLLNEARNDDGKKINTVNYLFSDIAPRYETRKGGYTRAIKLGPRQGDGAPMVKVELV